VLNPPNKINFQIKPTLKIISGPFLSKRHFTFIFSIGNLKTSTLSILELSPAPFKILAPTPASEPAIFGSAPCWLEYQSIIVQEFKRIKGITRDIRWLRGISRD